jgi:hypothetical protein
MSGYPRLVIFLILFTGFLGNVRAEEILTWQDCIKEAQKNHPDLISALENIKEKKADKAITASGFYPQIDSNLDASTVSTSTTSVTTGVTTKATSNTYTYGVTGTQLIFDGFKTINEVKTAKEFINAAEQSYRFASTEVRLNLRTAFINLLKAQELIRVAEDIMVQFLIEAILMSFLGGVVGILFGAAISVLITFFAGWAVRVSSSSIILATAFSLIVGIVFGLWPAQKASQLDPIEALRYE